MKRFILSPSEGQARFSRYAYGMHPQNFVGTYMRGGIRLC